MGRLKRPKFRAKRRGRAWPQGARCRRVKAVGKPRATNPFFIYLQVFRRNYKLRCQTRATTQHITRLAGESWRQMPKDEKLYYRLQAQKHRHQRDHSRRLHAKGRVRKGRLRKLSKYWRRQKIVWPYCPNYIV